MASIPATTGPLAGLRVVEFAGIGPGPFACMLLSDMGADVVSIERPTKKLGDRHNITGRGRSVVLADLKSPQARDPIWQLLAHADVLVEGFRPGVMERLGFGPEAVAERNPRLVYGRMTGWGQHGPLAQAAGHDINYISITGALHAIGAAGGPPVPPLNLVGDYGGGSLYLIVGILAALHEAERSGRGQVVDAAMSDGVISLMSNFVAHSLRGVMKEERGSNLLDGGAPWYGVFETAEGQHVSIGSIEPQFFADICERLGVAPALRDVQPDRARWPALRAEFERIFRTRTRAEWVALLEGTDVCFAPVLALSEAPGHPHNAARRAFVDVEGIAHPAPAPRFSRTPSAIQGPAPAAASVPADILARWAE
ncbi:MAG TPA: CaiB/BaiF CoA-transferase family protein [Variovorax sp.]